MHSQNRVGIDVIGRIIIALFVREAERLRIEQTQLSRAIKDLAYNLDVQLFDDLGRYWRLDQRLLVDAGTPPTEAATLFCCKRSVGLKPVRG